MGLIEKLDGLNKRVEALETSNIEGFDEIIARVEKLYGRITLRVKLKGYAYKPFFMVPSGSAEAWGAIAEPWGDYSKQWDSTLYPADDLYSDFVF